MTALLVVMVLGASASLALGLAGRRRVGRGWLLAEAAMLAAMLDVHLPALHLVPALLWSALLAGCALTAALLDRLRRARGAARHGSDALHAVGMLLASVLILVTDAAPTTGSEHAHGGGLALPLALAVVVYAACALRAALAGRPGRLDTTRRLASLAGLVAMGAMVAVG